MELAKRNVTDLVECVMLCSKQRACHSINYRTTGWVNNCGINYGSRKHAPNNYEANADYLYYEIDWATATENNNGQVRKVGSVQEIQDQRKFYSGRKAPSLDFSFGSFSFFYNSYSAHTFWCKHTLGTG